MALALGPGPWPWPLALALALALAAQSSAHLVIVCVGSVEEIQEDQPAQPNDGDDATAPVPTVEGHQGPVMMIADGDIEEDPSWFQTPTKRRKKSGADDDDDEDEVASVASSRQHAKDDDFGSLNLSWVLRGKHKQAQAQCRRRLDEKADNLLASKSEEDQVKGTKFKTRLEAANACDRCQKQAYVLDAPWHKVKCDLEQIHEANPNIWIQEDEVVCIKRSVSNVASEFPLLCRGKDVFSTMFTILQSWPPPHRCNLPKRFHPTECSSEDVVGTKL